MPRDSPFGNGSFLINFDQAYQIRDIYWPHVGQENHTSGSAFRFGVWVDGRFSWVSDGGWERRLEYLDDALVTDVYLHRDTFQLRMISHDAVDFHHNLFLRKLTVHNDADHAREVRLFFGQDFAISGNAVGDTAYYEPERRAMFHYKGQRWFMINVARQTEDTWELGANQWAAGLKGVQGMQGTWRDAEDGTLSGNPVVQGSVDSVIALHLEIPAGGEATGWYWIAVGETFEEVTAINRAVRHKGPETFLERTRSYWSLWATEDHTFQDFGDLPDSVSRLYARSLLIMRTQIDNHGAIIAANDFDVVAFNRDTYSYMWPRDGALVAATLTDAGYVHPSERFFVFCHRVITEEGYLLHKFSPDGSLASTWHGWLRNGEKVVPVQEDETALVLWAFWHHFCHFREVEFLKPHYRGLIVRAANWLASYRDESGLPLPSWDLWEERWGILAWTVGATWGGLQAGAHFAEAFGEHDLAASYRRAADEIRAGAEAHMWHPEWNRFVRMINRRDDGTWEIDPVLDASMIGLWRFGMFAPDDPRIVSTMEALRERLWIKTEVGGMARYENDYYHQVTQDIDNVPGNPWFICTLWMADWHIAIAQTQDELAPARAILEWAANHALPSGVMAEQVHPYTNVPISVSPLTWSHATYASTVRAYLARYNDLAPA